MNRRSALRQMFILAGGVLIATSCNLSSDSPTIALQQIHLNRADEDFLAELVEAIIPATDSPGGRDLNLHLFVMKMVDDCASPQEQQQFIEGLKAAQSVRGKAEQDQRAYLADLPSDDVFAATLKRRTIQGYKNSEYIMKNKLVYELVPGRYQGAVKMEA